MYYVKNLERPVVFRFQTRLYLCTSPQYDETQPQYNGTEPQSLRSAQVYK